MIGIPLSYPASEIDEILSLAVKSDITDVPGASQITNIVSLTQEDYDAILAPDATTLYVIVSSLK